MFAHRDPPRSTLELRWRVFGIQFRVMPSFWIVSAVLAYLLFSGLFGPKLADQLMGVATDVACYFLALVFMEMVQGVVYRSYGIRSTAVIQDFSSGIYPEANPPTRLQRIIVALSNPASAWLLCALVYYSNREFGWRGHSIFTMFAYELLYLVTRFWGTIGLLPIFPYSGGQVMMEVLTGVSRRRGLAITLVVSIVIAVAYIVYTVLFVLNHVPLLRVEGLEIPPSIIAAVFFGITAMNNWQLFQQLRTYEGQVRRKYEADDDRAPWER